MPEYLHGSACHYCGEVLTLRISIEDVRDDQGVFVDVSVEADMDPWWAHVTACREAADERYASRCGQALPQGP